ncbi:LORELEI-LIKE-GPI ANCHORED PROTEIN 3 [Raphanus sativus]|uniref:GPI-anchored protein LLG3-like n=1 Tax=Raphanus sativus TaxID=3726 RepID=A0A6J0KQ58_RAPSA|nr:GPI-anchored protein LLG3-like [Raphanus sativus]KAJ4880464.1 LORELEI-LIKE-GPI ANCHORED PROTEIN 3 [Raphanus sativus]
MKISLHCLVSLFSIILLSGFASSLHISFDEFKSHPATSRALLREKKPCKEDFASKDYTVLTSRCKGPKYQAKACCSAFKDFACPYAEAITDQTTLCADDMFCYLEIYGRYPLGLFAKLCKEGKKGLDCTNVKANSTSSRG